MILSCNERRAIAPHESPQSGSMISPLNRSSAECHASAMQFSEVSSQFLKFGAVDRQYVSQGRPPKAYDVLVTAAYVLDARDRPTLLFTMIRALASDQSRIAFKGNLTGTELYELEGASHAQMGQLKRAAIAPQLDLVVFPLSSNRVDQIERQYDLRLRSTVIGKLSTCR